MNNANRGGGTLRITGPATSGVPVIVGILLAIPVATLASGEIGAAVIDHGPETPGVFELPKLSTAVIAAGALLHWDVSAGEFIVAATATGDLENCAVAVEAAGNGTTTVKAKLLPGRGAVKA